MSTNQRSRRIMNVLTANPWFVRLDASLQSALLREADVKSADAGTWIYGTGDAPRGVFAVLEGAALIHVALRRGDDVLVHVAVPGDLFGHAARLGRGPRLATVIAAETSTLLYLPEATLDRLSADYPVLWPSLTRLLYEQLGELLILLAQARTLPARCRLAVRLLQLSGRRNADPRPINLTQAQLAELVGVSRKTINQLIGQFTANGWVRAGKRHLMVADRPALLREAQEDKLAGHHARPGAGTARRDRRNSSHE